MDGYCMNTYILDPFNGVALTKGLKMPTKSEGILTKWILGLLSALILLYVTQVIKGYNSDTEFKYKTIRIEVMSELILGKVNELKAHQKIYDKRIENQDNNILENRNNISELKRYVKYGKN